MESSKEQKSGILELNGQTLTISDLMKVSRNKVHEVNIEEACFEEMEKNRQYFEKVLDTGKVIYGVNTGYGGSADVRNKDTEKLQVALIQHLNAGFGDKLPSKLVKAVMVVRANALSRAYSGVRPCVAKLILDMVNHDILPIVPKRGSVSASGDLMPTSYIAAAMMGRKESLVVMNGQRMSVNEAFTKKGLQPIEFKAKEALAVLNSSSFASALAADVLYQANIAIMLVQISVALGVEVLKGHLESFHPIVHQCMPHPGQIEVAYNIRNILNGSKLAISELEINREDEHMYLKQDRYALRCSAQWLSPVLETLKESIRRVSTDINSANDNPIIDHRTEVIAHSGNFQGSSITVAMDQSRQSLQMCGKLLFALMSEIVNVKMNQGLTPNLCGSDPTTDFGFKGTDTAMASYMSELDLLTNPLTNHVLSAELHNQSINSMALVSSRKSEEALDILHMMLANILNAQMQAIDLRWMEVKVTAILEKTFKSHDIKWTDVPKEKYPWYSFLFNLCDTVTQISSDTCFGVGRVQLNGSLGADLNDLWTKMLAGELVEEISNSLGKGTKKLYLYLRKDLCVKFNYGEVALDLNLEKIYKAIKHQDIDEVVLRVFQDLKL